MRPALILSGLMLLASCSPEAGPPSEAAVETVPEAEAPAEAAPSATLSTGDTTLEMGAAAQDVVYPAGAPAYPGSKVIGSMTLDPVRAGRPGQLQIYAETTDAPLVVAEFYRAAMIEAGFTIGNDFINTSGGVLQAKTASGEPGVMVQLAVADGKTVVTIAGDDPAG